MLKLLYLHGFLSSPASQKAVLVGDWLAKHRPDIEYHCPFLRPYPKETQYKLKKFAEEHQSDDVYVIGSSLGGYWATWLVENFALRAVLINPLVDPNLLNSKEYIGVELKNYHTDEVYKLKELHSEQLLAVNIEKITQPENYWVMLQMGDETLDYRLAVRKYAGCKQSLEEGGDHSFQNFDNWIPAIIEFLEAS